MVSITPAIVAKQRHEDLEKQKREERDARAKKRKEIEHRVRTQRMYQKPFKDERLVALKESLK